LIPVVFVRFALPLISVPEGLGDLLKDALSLLLIGSGAWLFVRCVDMAEALFLGLYKVDVEDNLEARKIHTQVRYIKRVFVIAILFLATGSMLMMFEKVRQFGVGIMTSAGIAGIVIGLAAQKSIANLLTGVQIAVTQPIRLDDVVIVENEWGWIEEITSTYVVVRLWDLRRLIVPLTYFTEKPFQNWTRTSANIIGSVFIYLDYGAPIEEIRNELHRILRNSELWDQKTWVLQVTNSTEKTMELRALMSAKNAPRAWDLRCEVREKLIVWLQRNYPSSLPRFRVETERKSTEGENMARSFGEKT
jgi:small-conductance mechanosensitive channel